MNPSVVIATKKKKKKISKQAPDLFFVKYGRRFSCLRWCLNDSPEMLPKWKETYDSGSLNNSN